MRKTFAVGKLTGRTAEILLLESKQATAAGPLRVRAVVRPAPCPPPPTPHLEGLRTIH